MRITRFCTFFHFSSDIFTYSDRFQRTIAVGKDSRIGRALSLTRGIGATLEERARGGSAPIRRTEFDPEELFCRLIESDWNRKAAVRVGSRVPATGNSQEAQVMADYAVGRSVRKPFIPEDGSRLALKKPV